MLSTCCCCAYILNIPYRVVSLDVRLGSDLRPTLVIHGHLAAATAAAAAAAASVAFTDSSPRRPSCSGLVTARSPVLRLACDDGADDRPFDWRAGSKTMSHEVWM